MLKRGCLAQIRWVEDSTGIHDVQIPTHWHVLRDRDRQLVSLLASTPRSDAFNGGKDMRVCPGKGATVTS